MIFIFMSIMLPSSIWCLCSSFLPPKCYTNLKQVSRYYRELLRRPESFPRIINIIAKTATFDQFVAHRPESLISREQLDIKEKVESIKRADMAYLAGITNFPNLESLITYGRIDQDLKSLTKLTYFKCDHIDYGGMNHNTNMLPSSITELDMPSVSLIGDWVYAMNAKKLTMRDTGGDLSKLTSIESLNILWYQSFGPVTLPPLCRSLGLSPQDGTAFRDFCYNNITNLKLRIYLNERNINSFIDNFHCIQRVKNIEISLQVFTWDTRFPEYLLPAIHHIEIYTPIGDIIMKMPNLIRLENSEGSPVHATYHIYCGRSRFALWPKMDYMFISEHHLPKMMKMLHNGPKPPNPYPRSAPGNKHYTVISHYSKFQVPDEMRDTFD